MSVPNGSRLYPPEKPIRLLLVAPSLRILGGQAVEANYLLEHQGREPQFDVSFVPHTLRPKLQEFLA